MCVCVAVSDLSSCQPLFLQQIKPGTNNVIVRNNVCYNTYGVCILLYDDYNRGQNIAEGNLVITVRADNGIQVHPDVIIASIG